MNKITLLTIAVLILLLLNAVTLYFLFNGKGNKTRNHSGGRPGINLISQKLKFDEQQDVQFKRLSELHKKEVETMRNDDKILREALVNMIKTGVKDSLHVDSVSSLLAANRKKMELTFFYHFSQIRSLCQPDQIELFNQTLDEMMKRRVPGQGQKDGRR